MPVTLAASPSPAIRAIGPRDVKLPEHGPPCVVVVFTVVLVVDVVLVVEVVVEETVALHATATSANMTALLRTAGRVVARGP